MNRKTRRAMMFVAVACIVLLIGNFMTSAPEATPPPKEGTEAPGGGEKPPGAAPVKEDEAPVVIAQMDIPKQRKITADMVKVVQMPVSLKHTDAATDVRQVLDHYSLVNLYAKEQLLLQRLGESNSADVGLAYVIGRGKRAVSIPMTEDRAVGGYIAPGKLVDVIGTFKVGGSMVTRPVLRRKKILAINEKYVVSNAASQPAPPQPQPQPQQGEAAKAEGFARIEGISAVTLEVTPQEGEKLMLASQNSPLSLEIVNPDAFEEPQAPVRQEDVIYGPGLKGTSPAGGPAVAGAPQPQQGPPPVMRVEIIRFKSKENQDVPLLGTTSMPAQLAATGPVAITPTATPAAVAPASAPTAAQTPKR